MIKDINIKMNGQPFTDLDLKLNNLNIFVGQNGTGKSLLNKIIWTSTMIALLNEYHKGDTASEFGNLELNIEDLIRKTFFDSENLELEVKASTSTGYIHFIFNEDKLKFLDVNISENIPYPKYLSTTTRLYTGIQSIINNLDTIQTTKYTRLEEVGYPMYDITYCFQLKVAFEKEDYVEFEQQMITTLKDHYNLDIVGLIYKDKFFYYKDSKGVEKKAITLSNGEQSILSMFCSQII